MHRTEIMETAEMSRRKTDRKMLKEDLRMAEHRSMETIIRVIITAITTITAITEMITAVITEIITVTMRERVETTIPLRASRISSTNIKGKRQAFTQLL